MWQVMELSADVTITNNTGDIKLQNVDVMFPSGELLLRNLTFELKQCQSMMVVGPNGVGKSSMFRVMGDCGHAGAR